MPDDVSGILAGAKKTLQHAQDFTKSIEHEAGTAPAKPMAGPPAKHEFSNAPYSIAKEAGDVGKELKNRMESEAKARKSLQ